jgi:fibronectin-binding autotransporter adhesin
MQSKLFGHARSRLDAIPAIASISTAMVPQSKAASRRGAWACIKGFGSHGRANARVSAVALATAALLAQSFSGAGVTQAASVPSDTAYQYQNSAGSFSTGFTPTFPGSGDINGELDFAGTNYAVIDDLTSASVNNLTFAASGLVSIAPSGPANLLTLTSNSSGIAPSMTVGSGGASIGVVLAGTDGMTKNGAGTLTLTAANTYSGTTSVNLGTLFLDFTASGAPTTNIINSASTLTMGGGALAVNGGSSNSQAFASATFGTASFSTLTAAGGATLALGGLTDPFGGTVEFVGPATINAPTTASGDGTAIASTGTITTTTVGGTNGILTADKAGATGGADYATFATVGLYDFAAVSGGAVIGLSQATGGSAGDGGYTMVNGASAGTGGIIDVLGASNTNSSTSNYDGIRFNGTAAASLNIRSVTSTRGILVTPNLGANNVTLSGSSQFAPGLRSSSNSGSMVIWQNNTAGFLNINIGILDNGKKAGSTLVQAGPGTVVYSANSYTGQTALEGGISEISSDAGLGSASTGAQVTLNGGTILGKADFSLDNAGANLRPVILGGNGGTLSALTGTLMNVTGVVSGGGPLNIGVGQIPGTGAATANPTAAFGDGGVVLSGANMYTGATNVNFGSLLLGNAGSIASTSAVSVAPGAVLGTHYTGTAGSASIAGAVSLNGGTLSMLDGATGTLNLNGGLTFSSNAALSLELGAAGSPGTSDVVSLGSVGILNVSAPTPINFATLAGFGPGTYTLLTFGSGDASGLGNFAVGTHPNGFQFALGNSSTSEFVTVTGNATPPVAYWTGAQDANWNTITAGSKTNFSNDAQGLADTGQVPGSITDVKFIAANGQNLNTTLGADFIIKGLEFNAAAAQSVTIGGANSLTIGADGLTVDAGSGAHTINATGNGTLSGLVASADQSWANNSSNPLTITSGITGMSAAGQTTTLTFNGSGAGGTILNGIVGDGLNGGTLALVVNKSAGLLVLGGANTFSGGLTLSQGTVQAASATAPAGVFGSGPVTLADNTTLDLNGSSPTTGLLATSGTGAGASVTSTAGSNLTLTLSGVGTATFAGTIGNGAATSLNLIKLGSGTQNLAGANTYTGTTQANGGTLAIVAGGVLGTADAPAGAMSANGGLLSVAGGSLYTNALATIAGNGSNGFLESGGTATFNAGIQTIPNTDAALIQVTGGTFTASSLTMQRTAAFTGTLPINASTTSGFYVNPGTNTAIVNLGTVAIGTGNSSASMRVDGGTVTASGEVAIGNNGTGSGRFSILQVNGGSFTSTDATNGIVIAAANGGATSTAGELYLSGGTTTAQRISFGQNAADTATSTGAIFLGTATNPATLYLGGGGIVQTQTSNYTSSVTLNNGTVGATADWSTALPATIGTSVTFQAADASNAPHDIALGGALTGAGALTKTGGGTLTLGAVNSYTGGTTINAGTVLANALDPSGTPTGSLGTGPIAINPGGKLGGGAPGASGGVHVAGPISVNAGTTTPGGTISAGTATATANLITAAQTWNGSASADGTGGTYAWKLNLASAGTAGTLNTDKSGTNWDQLSMSGLSVSGNFNLQVIGLNSASIGTGGQAFNPVQPYSWVAANVPTANLTTANANFVLPPPSGFGNTALGVFSAMLTPDNASPDMSDVVVSYNPAPEPTSLALLGLAAGGLLLRRRRRRAGRLAN